MARPSDEPVDANRPEGRTRTTPPPPKVGKVGIDDRFSWFHQAAFMGASKAEPRMTAWIAKLDLPQQIGVDRDRAWPEIDRTVSALRSHDCVVTCVSVQGYRIGDTAACEAHWTLEFLAPQGFNPVSAGLGRAYK